MGRPISTSWKTKLEITGKQILKSLEYKTYRGVAQLGPNSLSYIKAILLDTKCSSGNRHDIYSLPTNLTINLLADELHHTISNSISNKQLNICSDMICPW